MLFAVASAHVSRGNALLGLGRAEEAALDFATAMDAFGSVNRIHEDPIYARQSRVVAAIRRGDALAAMGRKQACRSLWQEAMREAERLHAEDSHSALALGNLNEARRRLGLAPRDGSVPSLPDPRLPAASVP
jgi:predicted negative regulator of RcsB-dependent stress response